MKSFLSFLTEEASMGFVKLTPAEWRKPNTAHPEKKARTDILIDAIKSGTELHYAIDGKAFKLKNNKDNIDAVEQFKKDGKVMTLFLDNGQTITSSQIGKSALFGGGSGAGGGTANTAIVESAQCLWLAAMIRENRLHDIEYYTPEKLSAAWKHVNVGKTTLKECLDLSAAWKLSSYLSAKKIIQEKFVNRSHKFHRDSRDMQIIYKMKDEAFKNEDNNKISHDKWNPGDIWAIKDGFDVSALDNTTVAGYNAALVKAFNDRDVVGISLKAVKKIPKIVIYNLEEAALDQHRVTGIELSSKRGTFFSSKTVNIVADNKYIVKISANSYMGTLKLELQGKTARGGGAGWGVAQNYAKKLMAERLEDNKSLKAVAQTIHKGGSNAKKLAKTFYAMAKNIDKDIGDYKSFEEELLKKDVGWIHAKWGCTVLAHMIYKRRGKRADDFMSAIINYAGSKLAESSVYIKVYE